MIGIPIGLFASNATEWFVHKYVLHGRGKRRSSFWSFHFHEHHRAARENVMFDEDYLRPALQWHAQGKEIFGLVASTVPWLVIAPIAPFFVGTVVYCTIDYYRKHKRAHLDPEWARENLPWHYDHHMGPDQDANWCVTRPWFDHIMGTRKPYVGTEAELKDRENRKRLADARAKIAGPAMPVTGVPAPAPAA